MVDPGAEVVASIPELAVRQRAWMFAERLIQCERFLAGGSARVNAGRNNTVDRMLQVGLRRKDRRGVSQLMFTLSSGGVSEKWVRGYHATLKQRLAEIVGCDPREIETGLECIWKRTTA